MGWCCQRQLCLRWQGGQWCPRRLLVDLVKLVPRDSNELLLLWERRWVAQWLLQVLQLRLCSWCCWWIHSGPWWFHLKVLLRVVTLYQPLLQVMSFLRSNWWGILVELSIGHRSISWKLFPRLRHLVLSSSIHLDKPFYLRVNSNRTLLLADHRIGPSNL